MNEEKITKATIIILCSLVIIAFILIILLGQKITSLQIIAYNQQIEACQKNTLIKCFPKELYETRIISCKCTDGTTKRVNLLGEPI